MLPSCIATTNVSITDKPTVWVDLKPPDHFYIPWRYLPHLISFHMFFRFRCQSCWPRKDMVGVGGLNGGGLVYIWLPIPPPQWMNLEETSISFLQGQSCHSWILWPVKKLIKNKLGSIDDVGGLIDYWCLLKENLLFLLCYHIGSYQQ